MGENQLDDLKQFIVVTVSQTEKRLEAKITHEITDVRSELAGVQGEIAVLRDEMADGFSGIGDAIESLHDQIAERDFIVDTRLKKLEQRAA